MKETITNLTGKMELIADLNCIYTEIRLSSGKKASLILPNDFNYYDVKRITKMLEVLVMHDDLEPNEPLKADEPNKAHIVKEVVEEAKAAIAQQLSQADQNLPEFEPAKELKIAQPKPKELKKASTKDKVLSLKNAVKLALTGKKKALTVDEIYQEVLKGPYTFTTEREDSRLSNLLFQLRNNSAMFKKSGKGYLLAEQSA